MRVNTLKDQNQDSNKITVDEDAGPKFKKK